MQAEQLRAATNIADRVAEVACFAEGVSDHVEVPHYVMPSVGPCVATGDLYSTDSRCVAGQLFRWSVLRGAPKCHDD